MNIPKKNVECDDGICLLLRRPLTLHTSEESGSCILSPAETNATKVYKVKFQLSLMITSDVDILVVPD